MNQPHLEGMAASLGFKVEAWEENFARVSLDAEDRHLNPMGIVHGGTILAMMDHAAGLSGLWCSVPGNRRYGVTVDLDCRFTGKTEPGRVVAEATVVSQGRSTYFCRIEVRDGDGLLVAFGSSTHRWRGGSEGREGVPG